MWPVGWDAGELRDEEVEALILPVRRDTTAVRQSDHAVQRAPEDFGDQFASHVVRTKPKVAAYNIHGGTQR
ncbi:hypothetical protein AB0K60_32755 [Thermopolyspora sp. NPDC052614]|uniref:hypothetical protein n=1 Tax=Thermopolyspora sp. NPDC052614 TaxID=3155682 RepID=UPI003432A375